MPRLCCHQILPIYGCNLTSINLMKQARPDPDFRLQQPQGPALQSLANTLLDTLPGILPLEMRLGIAVGITGEMQIHANRLVFSRPLNEEIPSNTSTMHGPLGPRGSRDLRAGHLSSFHLLAFQGHYLDTKIHLYLRDTPPYTVFFSPHIPLNLPV